MKCKANILLITLFLLMMSSMSALLITAYLRNLIRLSGSYHDYYQAYYIANAGLEHSLVKTNGYLRGYGFEDRVLANSSFVSGVLANCDNCAFNTQISSLSTVLADTNTTHLSDDVTCANVPQEDRFELQPGSCLPIVLLKDDVVTSSGGGLLMSVANTDLANLTIRGMTNATTPTITVHGVGNSQITALLTQVDNNFAFQQGWSRTLSWQEVSSEYGGGLLRLLTDNAVDANGRYVLMIANTTDDVGYYCMKSTNHVLIPTQYAHIMSDGRYGRTHVALQGVRKAGLPPDFCYTIINN